MTATTPHARPFVLGLALFVLTGCNQFKQSEVNWARGAIERNEHLEVVAVDAENRVLTVRDRRTGEMAAVRTDEVIGILPASLGATEAAPAQTPASEPAAPMPAAAPESIPSAPPAEAPPVEEPAGSPSYAVTPATADPGEMAVATAPGRTVASGPGYTIKKVSELTSAADQSQAAASSRRTSGPRSAVERRSDAIICQGSRLLHIDNRNLEFEGNAVTAENGCEIHITNSRIAARGVGVSARGANVHIKNSSIEGLSGSVEASEGAQIYLQSSTFKGLPRKLDTAEMHDMGGNVWN